MHCSKLLGDKLSARDFDSQVKEIHTRVTVLNKFTILGRPIPTLSLELEYLQKTLSLNPLFIKTN